MLYNIITKINWVDIFVVIVLLRVSYVSVNTGLPAEIFKLLGTISAIYLSLHYYASLQDFVVNLAGFKSIPLGLYTLVTVAILSFSGYAVFSVLRNFFLRLLNFENVSALFKLLGLGIGALRGILLSSLLIFMMVISGYDYFKTSVKDSYSGKFIFKIAPATYTFLWNGVSSRFMTGEKYNKNIPEIRKDLYAPTPSIPEKK